METIIHGDCLEELKKLPENSVDSICTDPPYGLSFMGKKWDYDVPSQEIWQECLRVLKPGGHLLSFAGTRTQHRMAVRIEDAGFEIRDMIAWIYASGFPKSLNIGKAVDKLQGNEREVVGHDQSGSKRNAMAGDFAGGVYDLTKGNSPWEGWGTALKPAHEPICMARKPISEKTVAENVLKYGTGGINIDESRVDTITEADKNNFHQNRKVVKEYKADDTLYELGMKTVSTAENPQGRFPANLIHDGSEEVVELFPNSKGMATQKSSPLNVYTGNALYHSKTTFPEIRQGFNDNGSAARFFYCAKASKKDRDEGLEGFEEKQQDESRVEGNPGGDNPRNRGVNKVRNFHPTVKPTALMRYLVKLVTPPGGTVLDPFTGSGSTGKACKLEGFNFIGIEREEEYVKIAKARIEAVSYTPTLL